MTPSSVPLRRLPSVPAAPWRPFVRAAWVFALSVGALSGALDLWVLRVRMMPVPPEHGRAHALAQLFGFLGLLVMGLSLRVGPGFFRGMPPSKRLERALTWLALGGVAGVVAARLGRLLPGSVVVGGVGAAALVAAWALWAWWVLGLWRRLPAPKELLHHFVLAGTGWWLLSAVGVAASEFHPVPAESIWAAALLGGASSWTWGIFLRAGMCQLQRPPPSARSLRVMFGAWQVMTALQVVAPWMPGSAWQPVASAALALSVGLLLWTLRPFTFGGELPVQARSMQAGLLFVGLSGVLAAWGALRGLGVPAPPLLTDAARHAYVLGGMVLLVSGFAGRMLPAFAGQPLRWPRLYQAGLLAVGAGALLRLAELFTTRATVALAGASGGLAFLGMVLLACSLWPVAPAARA